MIHNTSWVICVSRLVEKLPTDALQFFFHQQATTPRFLADVVPSQHCYLCFELYNISMIADLWLSHPPAAGWQASRRVCWAAHRRQGCAGGGNQGQRHEHPRGDTR
jgi:hypothetical protein